MQRHMLRGIAADAGQRVVFFFVKIDPAEFDGVYSRFRRRLVDQHLGHRAADRHADTAEHADDALVHIGDPRARMVVGQRIGRRRAGDRHHAFGEAETDIGRVGADRQRVVEIHRRDFAVPIDTHFRRAQMIAGLAVGDEGFETVGGVLHRLAEHLGDRGHRDFFAMDVDLEAEPAADIGRDHPHLVFRNAEMPGIDILHLIRRLVRLVHGQPFFHGAPFGEDRTPFEGRRRVAAEFEFMFDRERCRRQPRCRIAGNGRMLETQIVAELGMDRHRRRVERFHHIHDDGQLFPVHHHQIDGVFRFRPRRRHDGGDGFALITGAVDRQHVLRCGFMTGPVRRDGNHGLADRGHFRTGHDTHDAGRPGGHGRLDALDAGVAVRAAHEGDVQHVRHGDIVGVASAAVDQAADVGPGDPRADETFGVSVRRAHTAALVFAVASTASTIA